MADVDLMAYMFGQVFNVLSILQRLHLDFLRSFPKDTTTIVKTDVVF